MRWPLILLCSAVWAVSTATARAQAAPAKTPAPQVSRPFMLPPGPRALLPEVFAGWVSATPPEKTIDAAKADPASVEALKEYGFTDSATATYKRSGETLTLRALRFEDASGAYGAYSFHRQNNWPKEEIGTGATSNHNRVLFWLRNTVVDEKFQSVAPRCC